MAEPIASVPPPWTLKGDVYTFAFWTQVRDGVLPAVAYSPLEAQSDYASSGTPLGGLGMLQVIRYRDSPVGPYDEMLVAPGSFGYEREDAGARRVRRKSPRITRIYVSQRDTCYNGRKTDNILDWNVPKHLARFSWTDNPDGSTTVHVYPHDTWSPSPSE
ncbi:hypothetical protein FZEAL_3990, partial [Fusarium zealandicum]